VRRRSLSAGTTSARAGGRESRNRLLILPGEHVNDLDALLLGDCSLDEVSEADEGRVIGSLACSGRRSILEDRSR